MQPERLEINRQRQAVLPRDADECEERVERHERDAAREPAAEEFSQHQFRARHGFGEQREDRAALALERNLPRRGGHRDDECRDPDQEQADFLEMPDDLRVVEHVHAREQQRDERDDDEQHVEILAPVKLADDDARKCGDFVHGQGNFRNASW